MQETASTKVIVLGAPSVGKTALVIRCLSGQFFQNYISRSDTAYHLKLHGTSVDIVDSSGKNEALISYADGFVLVYSITDRKSFDHLRVLFEKIRRVNLHNVKIAVVATKADKQKHRQVSREEGEKFAIDNKCLFFETSAYIPKEDIKEIFRSICKKIGKKNVAENSSRGQKFIGSVRHLVTRRRMSSGSQYVV